jgi:hypothetical protein
MTGNIHVIRKRTVTKGIRQASKTIPSRTRGERENSTHFSNPARPIMPILKGLPALSGVNFASSYCIFTPSFANTFFRVSVRLKAKYFCHC